MMKELSIFVDEDTAETHSGFDLNEVSEDEIFLGMMHMAYVLQTKGFDMESTFKDILESLRTAEPLEDSCDYTKPHGLLH